jgi:TRAP-type mannitol/chloroaromatic compound transport system permease large subunit
MTSAQIALLMLGVFIFLIMLGFPIWVTLMAMGVFFGYSAMGDRIFALLTQNTFSILSNDVLTAVPLFLFMGYIVERANILDRLFFSIQVAAEEFRARWRWRRCLPALFSRLPPGSSVQWSP